VPTARAGDVDLCYETFGSPEHPALLLIMGLGAQMILWDEGFCEALTKQSLYVIRYDQRDCGLSTRFDALGVPDALGAIVASSLGHPRKPPYTLGDMARDALGLLDALGVRAAHVAGSSMGGMIAQILAIEHPDRVLSLTSIMSTSGDPKLPPASAPAAELMMKPPPQERDAYIEHGVALQRVVSGTGYPFDEARARARASGSFDRGIYQPGALRQLVAMLAAKSRQAALASVRVPALVVHGDEDPLSHPAGGRDTGRCLPAAELLMLRGVGHDLPPQVWDDVAHAIARTVRRAEASV
jgi:pimeloyl-ACP methyl ester carboxylesterase